MFPIQYIKQSLLIMIVVSALLVQVGCGQSSFKRSYLEINPQEIIVYAGEIQPLSATYYDVNGEPASVNPIWHVTSSAASIDAGGLLYANSIGATYIEASYLDASSFMKIEIESASYVLGEVILRFNEGIEVDEIALRTNSESINALFSKYEVGEIQQIYKPNQNTVNDPTYDLYLARTYKIKLLKKFNIHLVSSELKEQSEVEYAHPNYILSLEDDWFVNQ